jgi:hypothetical protein
LQSFNKHLTTLSFLVLFSAFSATSKPAVASNTRVGAKVPSLAVLDSDEESLAEFIGQLSASSASEKIPHTRAVTKVRLVGKEY